MKKINASCLLIEKLYELLNLDLSSDVFDNSKLHILDWIGCYIASKKEAPIDDLIQLFESTNAGASVYLASKKFKARESAFINSFLGHYYEMDDVHKEAIMHPGAIIIPVVLSVVEEYKIDITYEMFCKYVVAGYEAIIKLGIALNPSHYIKFHTTGTAGTIAAALIASSIIDKRKDVNLAAINIATTMASGLISSFGFDSKLITLGHATMNGILAAELASKGLSANLDALEDGFYKAFSDENKLIQSISNITKEKLEIDNVYFKIHASCGHTHSALDAALKIIEKNDIDIKKIKNINIFTYKTSLEITSNTECYNRQQCQFSNPVCMAILLYFGNVTIDGFGSLDSANEREKILELANKVSIIEDINYTKMYPVKRPSKVQIIMTDNVYEAEQILPNKHNDKKVIISKFMSLTRDVLNESQISNIISLILNYDKNCKINSLIEDLNIILKENK